MTTLLEEGINKVIGFFGLLKENFNVEDNYVLVNKDFSSNVLSPEQIDRLIALRQDGIISKSRLNKALVKGEILTLLNDDEQALEDTELKDDSMGEGELS